MRRIIVVDDHKGNRYLLQALLQGYGYIVVEASNGAEALDEAERNAPELVISDLLMPVMDGYTLLRRWKADARLRDIPFIVYSATYTEPKDQQLAFSLGSDAFIIKPAEPELFMTRILEVLAKAKHKELSKHTVETVEEPGLSEAYSKVLFGKLEKRAVQLAQTNWELREEIAERARTEAALRQSEERFRELAETIHEVFWMTDHVTKRMLYVSPAYEKIWGRTCVSVDEFPDMWLDSIHPDDRERMLHAVQIKQTRGDYDETYRIQRPDGTVRWIRDRAFPVSGTAGEVVRVVGTAEDVTDRRQLEEQYRQAQKMEVLGQLSAGVAHDFNNIVAAILGNAQLALADTAEGHPARESLEEIRKASVRAKSLVQQILAFSSQQSQKLQVISLGSNLHESINLLRAILPPVIEFVTLIEAVPPVLADPTQIHQVVTNLCTNAWHALENQPGRIEVKLQSITLDVEAATRLKCMKPGGVICLSVTDTGKGMDDATLQRIFNPFFTTKDPGIGIGLGLSLVHSIVQAHNGAISVTSQPGQGTTFRVYFPAASEPMDSDVTSPLTLHHGGGQHILFLDDEEPLVFLATRILHRLGYRVTGFTRAADATTAFRKNPGHFDLVITDLNMPGASGLDVAADLLKLRPDLPIIICSGHLTEDLVLRARNAGILKVLHKPSTIEEFGEAIHGVAAKIRQS